MIEVYISEEQRKKADAMEYIDNCIQKKGYYTFEEFEKFNQMMQ